MELGIISGIRVYEFFRSKNYAKSFEEFGRVALKPPGKVEIGYIPVTVYYSHPYTEQCVKYLIERDGFTIEEFYNWLKANG